MEQTSVIQKNRRFYDEYVTDMIHNLFGEYESRIAVGIAGEGSDCFGYDDVISRDHDFGTGVCLWLPEEDMEIYGRELSAAYERLTDSTVRSFYTERLRERRGVMTIREFYSNILRVECDTKACSLSEEQWYALDHSCLKTAVNGAVFRDDLGEFTAFRKMLLEYYPDRVWRMRIAEQLHVYASALQVNYARCMVRKDTVAAELCRSRGLQSAMELFFLLKREYPPYYKWTYKELMELDAAGEFSGRIQELADSRIDPAAWEDTKYHPNRPNYKDRIVSLADEIASEILLLLRENGVVKVGNVYLETAVDEVLGMRFERRRE